MVIHGHHIWAPHMTWVPYIWHSAHGPIVGGIWDSQIGTNSPVLGIICVTHTSCLLWMLNVVLRPINERLGEGQTIQRSVPVLVAGDVYSGTLYITSLSSEAERTWQSSIFFTTTVTSKNSSNASLQGCRFSHMTLVEIRIKRTAKFCRHVDSTCGPCMPFPSCISQN